MSADVAPAPVTLEPTKEEIPAPQEVAAPAAEENKENVAVEEPKAEEPAKEEAKEVVKEEAKEEEKKEEPKEEVKGKSFQKHHVLSTTFVQFKYKILIHYVLTHVNYDIFPYSL